MRRRRAGEKRQGRNQSSDDGAAAAEVATTEVEADEADETQSEALAEAPQFDVVPAAGTTFLSLSLSLSELCYTGTPPLSGSASLHFSLPVPLSTNSASLTCHRTPYCRMP